MLIRCIFIANYIILYIFVGAPHVNIPDFYQEYYCWLNINLFVDDIIFGSAQIAADTPQKAQPRESATCVS